MGFGDVQSTWHITPRKIPALRVACSLKSGNAGLVFMWLHSQSNQPRDAFVSSSMSILSTVGLTGVLALGMTGIAMAQENSSHPQRPNRTSQGTHGPRSIDQELDHLTKDLELTPKQRKQIRPLLEEHHDRIQALFDKNPKLSREDLGPQIHAISDETHHEIEALLNEHQKQLAKAMQERMRHGK